MDWGSVAAVVIGAIVGTVASVFTTSFAYQRTRSDQIQDVKRATYAQYLSALRRFPGKMTAFHAKPDEFAPEVWTLHKEMADLEEAISLLSPTIYQIIDDSPDLTGVGKPLPYQQLRQIVDDYVVKLRAAMRQDLDN